MADNPRRRGRPPVEDEEVRRLRQRLEQTQQQVEERRQQQQHEEQRRQEQALPLLCQLDGGQLSRFIDGLCEQLQQWQRFGQIASLLSEPRRFVENVVNALAHNSRIEGRIQQTYLMQVCRSVSRSWLALLVPLAACKLPHRFSVRYATQPLLL
jgi:hypothetical protein